MDINGDQDGERDELFVSPWRSKLVRKLGELYFRLGHRIQFVGRENMPGDGPFIVVSNHPTYMDPVIVGLGLKRWVHWYAWDEIFEWPVIGDWVGELGAIPVNLDRPQASTLRLGLRVLRDGSPLGIFFEGGRSLTPYINDPMPGAASLALRLGVPILPVTISGAFQVWPVTRSVPRLGPAVTVFYHPLIKVARMGRRARQEEKALTRRLQDIIEWPLRGDGRAIRPTRTALQALKRSPKAVMTKKQSDDELALDKGE